MTRMSESLNKYAESPTWIMSLTWILNFMDQNLRKPISGIEENETIRILNKYIYLLSDMV